MLKDVVDKYLQLFPQDLPKLGLLLKQLEAQERLDDRHNFNGHIAGDALVLSPDYKKILFIYHQRSGRWQQPGGHLESSEEGPWLTAEREAIEETGVSINRRLNISDNFRVPLHISTGPVYPHPSKKNELHHWHHDFRYVFVATSERLGKIQDEGIGGTKWVKLDEVEPIGGGHDMETSLERLLKLIA
ncbi:MAG TPA: NUDIX domain-containing protein [Candidatus Saccharimonadales bacterium]|nr:NUDIX domain-containing protein [Candidatus Saccharimonadales bacterium]